MPADYKYRDYRISSVFGAVDDRLAEELVAFWLRNKALRDREQAAERAQQVVLVARNAEGAIVGVSTVYPGRLNPDKRYYLYRMFIRPTDRIPGMMTSMTVATRDYLGGLKLEDKPGGIAIVAENPRIMRPGARRTLEKIGFACIGKTRWGYDVWTYEWED